MSDPIDRLKEEVSFREADPNNYDEQVTADLRYLIDRVAELEQAIYEVVNHGDASGDPELMAKLKRLTPEAGWTD